MRSGTWLVAALLALAAHLALAEEEREPKMPEVGARAPDFRLNDQTGKAVRFEDARKGRWAVLAFFPKAATPG